MYTADAGKAAEEVYGIHGVSLPLIYTKDPRRTKMYGGLGDRAFELATHNYTYNSHTHSFRPSTFENDKGLKSFWDVTAIGKTANGTDFVASIEAKNYPVFGT